MASARELLEQADALMRRNRSGGGTDIPVLTEVVVEALPGDELTDDVPVLTDVVEAGASEPEATPEPVAVAATEVRAAAPVPAEVAASPAVADAAALTRSVESIPVGLPMDGDTSDWLVMDTIDPSTHSITGLAPDTLAVVPPVTLKADADEPPAAPAEAPPSAAAPDVAPAPSPPATDTAADNAAALAAKAAAEDERWRALAEQVSMQVLQRVDLFTDAGLKTQLALHLEPIVERASSELVSAITEHVGGLLRTYVAEAIEREIALWRRDH